MVAKPTFHHKIGKGLCDDTIVGTGGPTRFLTRQLSSMERLRNLWRSRVANLQRTSGQSRRLQHQGMEALGFLGL